ncbi:hypothetical protein GGI11_002856 [Coemansia sp. RSA 2049]|nr:hypothetical protein GGI11_002856 [Coemansia sp. RSA 2049]
MSIRLKPESVDKKEPETGSSPLASEGTEVSFNAVADEKPKLDVISPPDTLRGWMVVGSSFILFMLVAGYTNSFGVYLQECQLHVFPTTPSSTLSWIGSLQFGCICLFGVVRGVLVEQYKSQIIIAIGGILMGALFLATIFAGGTYYMPYYFVTSYSAVVLKLSKNWGANISSILNASSIVERIATGILGDRVGTLNTMFVIFLISAISLFAIWLPLKSLGTLVASAVVFGIASSSIDTLLPVVTAKLFGIKRLSSILGLMFISYTIGTFISAPVGGVLLDDYGH